ncbi:unnamed protein product [Durusdinium trenchii]|uniref:Cyclic nucleotide-binding domain-containing protein n=1 Tax=Durusdinium trenchii TaxID=1381693 RepID=A0ABP0JL46_9DINO
MGDPIQEVFFVAEGIFSVSLREGPASKTAQRSEIVTSLLRAPACFGWAAQLHNEHFEESLTCSAAGKLYVLQLKHLLMMLSAAQQEALTRAAQQERRFHWARASLMRAMNRRPARQLYAVGGRLAALGEELRALAQAAQLSHVSSQLAGPLNPWSGIRGIDRFTRPPHGRRFHHWSRTLAESHKKRCQRRCNMILPKSSGRGWSWQLTASTVCL